MIYNKVTNISNETFFQRINELSQPNYYIHHNRKDLENTKNKEMKKNMRELNKPKKKEKNIKMKKEEPKKTRKKDK